MSCIHVLDCHILLFSVIIYYFHASLYFKNVFESKEMQRRGNQGLETSVKRREDETIFFFKSNKSVDYSFMEKMKVENTGNSTINNS